MKYETEYIHRFLKSVLKIDLSLEEISRKHSELDKQSGTPDFYVDNPPTIIELKRVFDRDELEVHKKWESSSNNLANEIKALSDFRKVNKYISVFSGYFVKPKKMLKKIAPSLLNAILDGAKELICDGIHFRIHSIPSDAPDIGFSVVGDARWFSSEKTIAKNLIENIVHANTQIGNFKTLNPGKGIILAVNQYYFGNDYRPYFGALYEDWQKIYSLSSIDEIWILIQSKNGEPQEKMIFSRDIFSMLMAGTAKYADIDIVFFQEAFYYLFKIEVIQETLLRVYGGFVERKHPSDVFSNPDTTEDFIEIGIWLSKEKRYDECAEFIRRYINDPNLSCNVHDTLHKEIISGKSVNYIVSVPGRLSFVIQKLALSPSHFKEALEFTAILLQDENFYVKHQGCIPLIELAAKSRSERVTSNDKQNLKLLLLDSIEKYGNREPIAKRLVEACCFLEI